MSKTFAAVAILLVTSAAQARTRSAAALWGDRDPPAKPAPSGIASGRIWKVSPACQPLLRGSPRRACAQTPELCRREAGRQPSRGVPQGAFMR
jgi:hypothetical protein